MSDKARYIDAEKLITSIRNINTYYGSNYTSGVLDQAVNQLINQAVSGGISMLCHSLITAIEQAATPYDKCLLCVQKDSCLPPNLGI